MNLSDDQFEMLIRYGKVMIDGIEYIKKDSFHYIYDALNQTDLGKEEIIRDYVDSGTGRRIHIVLQPKILWYYE